MMKRLTIYIITIISAMLSGYFIDIYIDNILLKKRLEYAIEYENKYGSKRKNEIIAKSHRDTLATLLQTNVDKLKKPEIATSFLVGTKEDTYRFYLVWLEDKPSVDKIQIRFNKCSNPLTLPISKGDKQLNQEVSDKTVAYSIVYEWKQSNEIANILANISNGTNINVRMLRKKSVVTKWFPVSFYKIDHWIAKIPNPYCQ